MVEMEEKLCSVLVKGGVNLHEQNGTERNLSSLLSLLESWLGFSDTNGKHDVFTFDDDGMIMMEESGPFDAMFYKAVEEFLIEVWKTEDEPRRKFFELESHYGSLNKSVLSVRVTRLLRYWMELNVRGSEEDDESMADEEKDSDMKRNTLTFHLLKHCSFDVKATSASNLDKKFKFFPLIQALYLHIEQLPFLQSQIYSYSQSLMRGQHNRADSNLNQPGLGLANPQLRLAQLQMGQRLKDKLEQEFDDHISDIEYIAGEWYAYGTVEVRRQCRAQLGSVWSTFEARSSGVGSSDGGYLSGGMRSENTCSSGIAMTLRILYRILMGIAKSNANVPRPSLCKSHEHLLFHHLIPLHRPNSMVLWRDQTSILDLYHEPLVKCIAILLKYKPEWTSRVIEGLLNSDVWNQKAGNTPKLVLLLHEIDTYIGCLPRKPEEIQGTELGDSLPILLRKVGSCMASENSRLAQRALPFVKNKKFVRLMEENLGLTLQTLLPFLLRKEPSWNPTVRKMTYNVLVLLRDFDSERFVAVGNRCFASERQQEKEKELAVSSKNELKRKKFIIPNPPASKSSLLPTDHTIKSAMGTWVPPTKKNNMSMPPPGIRLQDTKIKNKMGPPRSNPPLAVTGVAPWAIQNPQTNRTAMPRRMKQPTGVIGKGVAPWANTNNKPPNKNTTKCVEESTKSTTEALVECKGPEKIDSCPVMAYMEKIKPPEEDKGVSSWSQTQMAESPTLLPTLKFHNLVFGHDLGAGSFGSVRYARLINRNTTRSHWAEYAVKVISTEKIKTMGYESSIQREMAVLRILSHPCIARMISSFRFREGVYLVLEYAKGGDLHTLLKTNGSLDHDSTRFVIGEVTSALASIHEIGLGYFDLKPENIVITESGHVKLTDFGGCRPVTLDAKEMITKSAKNVFKDLRDGDWKPRVKKVKEFDMDDDCQSDDDDFLQDYDPDADIRIEGTTIYLPPEVALGSFPTLAADSWALGCVLYQCLSGRPPIFEADEMRAKNRIVSFDVKNSQSDRENSLFDNNMNADIELSARDLIIQLMNRNSNERLTMMEVASHSFFKDSGLDAFTLWRQPARKLECGNAEPPPADAGWARRQLSRMWAPQPQAYDIPSDDFSQIGAGANGREYLIPIAEGKEAPCFFSKTNILPSIRTASYLDNSMPPRKKIFEDSE